MMQNKILISATEFRHKLGDPDWVAIDCRSDLSDFNAGRRAYEEGHIPGAVFLDLDLELAGPVLPDTGRHPLPDAADVARRLGELGISSSDKVVVYDASHGGLAARAWWTFRWLGHAAVHLLDGGLANWAQQGLPVDDETVERTPVTYDARVNPSMIVTTEELASDLSGITGRNLLDARDRARFLGEQEPIDPVAGHVPGAINVPFTDFINEDGTWLPLAERAALIEDALGGDREAAWCVMCGSGVTACHLAISGLEAGLREPRLYVGSWSEWIRDPERPIGTGEG